MSLLKTAALSRVLPPTATTTPWSPAPCPRCGACLLLSQSNMWCCKNDAKLLPPCPVANNFVQINHPLNNISRRLNYLFVPSALTEYHGPFSPHMFLFRSIHFCASGNAMVLALSERTYYRAFPMYHLVPAQAALDRVTSTGVPLSVVDVVYEDLFNVNTLVLRYRNFAQFSPHTHVKLADPGPGQEIAALYCIGDAPVPSGRDLYVQRVADATPSRISILHPL